MVSLLLHQFSVCLMCLQLHRLPVDERAALPARSLYRSPSQPPQLSWSKPRGWNPVGRVLGSRTSVSRCLTSVLLTSKPHEHPSAHGFPSDVLALSSEPSVAMSSCLAALLPPGSFLLREFLFKMTLSSPCFS